MRKYFVPLNLEWFIDHYKTHDLKKSNWVGIKDVLFSNNQYRPSMLDMQDTLFNRNHISIQLYMIVVIF